MTSTQYPLQVPDDLMAEVEATALKVHLSKAAVMRQSIKLGLPKLREQLSAKAGRVTNVDPLPARVLERLYRERQDDDSSIRRFIAAQPKDAEESVGDLDGPGFWSPPGSARLSAAED